MENTNDQVVETIRAYRAISERLEQLKQARTLAEGSLRTLDLEEEQLLERQNRLQDGMPSVLKVGNLQLDKCDRGQPLVYRHWHEYEYKYSSNDSQCEFRIGVNGSIDGLFNAQITLTVKGQFRPAVMLRIEEPNNSFEACLTACERHLRNIDESPWLRGMLG